MKPPRQNPASAQDRPLASLLAQPGGAVHLTGIGGVGMAGLAYHLHARGFVVRGSDTRASRITAWLKRHGVTVYSDHAAGHVGPDVRWLIRTPAVPVDNPEVAEARRRGLPAWTRGEVLAALLRGSRSVAVCGTHGKTTTSAMLVHLLRCAGRDPSFLVGGEVDDTGAVAGAGSGGVIVTEADESDGTLALYAPDISVLTGIEYDHMENFRSAEDFEACFREVIDRTNEKLVYCADDAGARRLAGAVPGAVAYGLAQGSEFCAEAVQPGPRRAAFRLRHAGEDRGRFLLPAPGLHNVQNALAALATGSVLGLGFDEMREALADYRPVRRRFEWVRDDEDLAVVTDYAHHPTEIKAAVAAARGLGRRRLVALFQPHRYTRTRALGAEFPPAFDGVDVLILAPVYAASEAPLEGGRSEDLLKHFKDHGNEQVVLAKDLADAGHLVWSTLREGDMLLIVGAGDVNSLAAPAADWSERPNARHPGGMYAQARNRNAESE